MCFNYETFFYKLGSRKKIAFRVVETGSPGQPSKVVDGEARKIYGVLIKREELMPFFQLRAFAVLEPRSLIVDCRKRHS